MLQLVFHFINLSKKKKKNLILIQVQQIASVTIKLLGHQNLHEKTSILFLLWTTIVVTY